MYLNKICKIILKNVIIKKKRNLINLSIYRTDNLIQYEHTKKPRKIKPAWLIHKLNKGATTTLPSMGITINYNYYYINIYVILIFFAYFFYKSQTIAYGMFAARLHDPTLQTFSRQEAAELIPKSNPFLRKLFGYIAGPDIDDRIKWIVDSLTDIFLATDVKLLLADFDKTTHTEDPIIHFYETFLSEYDPNLRKARGVWYTPQPVVNFIVRTVDEILKKDFNLPQGLADTSKISFTSPNPSKGREQDKGIDFDKAREKDSLETPNPLGRAGVGSDTNSNSGVGSVPSHNITQDIHRVQILDPATGTGTFLAEVVKHIYKNFENQQGIWSSYVDNHLLPRLNGFELLMASYAMAHLKIDLLLSETGYKPTQEHSIPPRLRVFLTNSLEESHPDVGTLFANWLSIEANEASRIKRETPVMVIIGNPPYSGESANKGKWIMDLMEDYKKEPGGKEKLKEQNSKFINDDYVKFLRYGQYYIEKNGSGILAYINPHGFLDNPTFRGMRWNLLKTYDKIYTIDLHGNSKKKEVCPDGSSDVNVFDIEQGVSINVFVKTGKKKPTEIGHVFHYDLFGKREYKYNFLFENSLNFIEYQKLENIPPQYYFTKKNFNEQQTYDKGFHLLVLFFEYSLGVLSKNDNVSISLDKPTLKERIKNFTFLPKSEVQKKYNIKEDSRDWVLSKAIQDLKENNKEENYKSITYRPFDIRWTFFTGRPKGFFAYSQNRIMKNLKSGNNFALISGRQGQVVGNMQWNLSFITNTISDQNIFYRGGGTVFPLYLYSDKQDGDMISDTVRKPNLNMDILKQIADNLGMKFVAEKETGDNTFAPIDILDYIYAVLHSPSYRERYKEFLKIDFPRVPYPEDVERFWELVKLGGKLRQLHLLESPAVDNFITQYPIGGSNEVSKVKYPVSKDGAGKVYINDTQYFDGVPEVAWMFYIGGYQPAQKWLKDRKGRTLDFEDILHYQRIIVALTETARLMQEIDEVMEI